MKPVYQNTDKITNSTILLHECLVNFLRHPDISKLYLNTCSCIDQKAKNSSYCTAMYVQTQ